MERNNHFYLYTSQYVFLGLWYKYAIQIWFPSVGGNSIFVPTFDKDNHMGPTLSAFINMIRSKLRANASMPLAKIHLLQSFIYLRHFFILTKIAILRFSYLSILLPYPFVQITGNWANCSETRQTAVKTIIWHLSDSIPDSSSQFHPRQIIFNNDLMICWHQWDTRMNILRPNFTAIWIGYPIRFSSVHFMDDGRRQAFLSDIIILIKYF